MLRALVALFAVAGIACAVGAVYAAAVTPNPLLAAVVCGGPALALIAVAAIVHVGAREERAERQAADAAAPAPAPPRPRASVEV